MRNHVPAHPGHHVNPRFCSCNVPHVRQTARASYRICRMVTICPFFLLGLLGITFHLGSRPTKPSIAEEPIITTRSSRPSASMQSSVRVFPKGASFGDTEHLPIAPHGTARPAIGTSGSQHGVPGTGGVVSSTGLSAKATGAAHGRQESYVIHVVGDGTGEPGRRNSVSTLDPLERPILASEHSLRRMWQAGPGNDMDTKQVGFSIRGVIGDAWWQNTYFTPVNTTRMEQTSRNSRRTSNLFNQIKCFLCA